MSYNLELSKKCINEHEAEKAKLSRQVAEERPSTKLRMPNSGVESRLLQNARRDELKSKSQKSIGLKCAGKILAKRLCLRFAHYFLRF
ncbi:uncharacterized protein OCT59_011200 [Rhizophagus irregularis]|uniref:Uncharacterized protein n=1 Tax=Rhizophagus irregularis (strain DAOM 197198w) TaxID=1432141 RepID=A0A015LMW2_RHIIW|nr:hypothetical protein RirG_219480 [Rhizophagus irregularis DAOM 197198w]UZO19937.1 hypothetical protein OCT59_011200 [Rhizophagus irregularis]